MKSAINILIQTILLLCLTVGTTALAGTGVAGDDRSAVHTIERNLRAKTCSRFELPTPSEHRCQRVAAQASLSSRPRSHADGSGGEPVAVWHWTVSWQRTRAVRATTRHRYSATGRRAAFWHVFAYAPRLRN